METRWRRGRQPAAAHHPEGFGAEVEYQGGAAGAQAGGRPNQRMQLSGADYSCLPRGVLRRWRTADSRTRKPRAFRPQLMRGPLG